MSQRFSCPDAAIIGSGPNGLAAGITMARAGYSAVVYEAQDTIGGGARSKALTLPGFIHDVCSSVHPMAMSSPFFNELELEREGLRWIQPEIGLAHPFDNGEAAVLGNSLKDSIGQFGIDGRTIQDLLEPFIKSWNDLSQEILRPLHFPGHLALMTRFARYAFPPASRTVNRLKTVEARAVFGGMAAHSMLPFDRWGSSAFGILLWAACHSVGWPFSEGGSQAIVNALVNVFKANGGEIVTGFPVTSLDVLPKSRTILCDVTPRQFVKIAGDRLGPRYRRKFEKYRYGPGVFKMDWALDGPIPWNSAMCRRAGTIHIGGSFEEIAESELGAWTGKHSPRPFVILAQPSIFDPSRAPKGKHTAWAYCHVPHGSTVDMSDRIESQVERFACGFRQLILARSSMSTHDLETHNANLVGGDIGGGSMELTQLFTRPTNLLYSTSLQNIFLCSASTPPGPGVHGMCGYWAAKRAIREAFLNRPR